MPNRDPFRATRAQGQVFCARHQTPAQSKRRDGGTGSVRKSKVQVTDVSGRISEVDATGREASK